MVRSSLAEIHDEVVQIAVGSASLGGALVHRLLRERM